MEQTLNKLIPKLIALRKDLHKNFAELSGKEIQTTERILEYLKNRSSKVIRLKDTGVLEIISNGNANKRILIRGDIDALPIREINEFEHKSIKNNISHKCGHDGHTTILLGLSDMLNEHPLEDLEILLLWQAAEEIGAGAKMTLNKNSEYFQNIDQCFALHNLPGYKENQIIIHEGIFTPQVKSLIIRVSGKTSHAGEPDKGINPSMLISDLIPFIKNLDQFDQTKDDFFISAPVYIKMGSIDYGITAGDAEIHYTLRAIRPEVFENKSNKIMNEVNKLSNDYGLEVEIDWTEEFYANVNDKESVSLVKKAASINGFEILDNGQAMRWGEDFGLFTQKFRGSMFGLGIGEDSPALHNPDYDFNDNIIKSGIKMFYSILEEIHKQ